MGALLCFAFHKSSTFSCSAIARILHFPSSAHRLRPTQATFSPPTTHPLPACVSVLAPLHSNFPQMGTGRSCTDVRSASHASVAPQAEGSQDQRWSGGTRGWVTCRRQHRAAHLSWQSEPERDSGETDEPTSKLRCIVWLRVPVYLYVSLLQRRKPLLLDPDVRGRTDRRPT